MTTELTYADASKLALRHEMEADPTVWVLGEDIGPEGGGAGGQYDGLQETFGKKRIVDTPISEAMIAAAGIGAAVVGTRPVIELRYADLSICAADEIVNQAAKIRYMFNGQTRVPIVLRQGVGISGGNAAQHAQSLEAWWIHTPGLIVVAPATPADSYGLLRAAIRADDPVIFLEHKLLWKSKGAVDTDAPLPQLGVSTRVRKGSDITVVTWSAMRQVCETAAAELDREGISVELIDLRTLWPWDEHAVLESVRRTGRLLAVHESVQVAGFGGEIVATVIEHASDVLKSPPLRMGAPRSPVPYSLPLENMVRVTSAGVAARIRAMMERAG